jgi:hypothetical protein
LTGPFSHPQAQHFMTSFSTIQDDMVVRLMGRYQATVKALRMSFLFGGLGLAVATLVAGWMSEVDVQLFLHNVLKHC